MLRPLQVAVALLITFAAETSLLAQRGRSGGHIGVTSHGSPLFSSSRRSFATPARRTIPPGHAPFAQHRHRPPYGEHRGGVGYRSRYPFFYAGYPSAYPGLLSFGYGNDPEESAPQVAPDYVDQPPVDNLVAGNAPVFRPVYQHQGPPEPAQPATTLVFRDGRPCMEVHNYALTGTTLYALDGEKRLEIPLSQLDLAATTETNRKTGVDFALPTSH